MSLETQAHDYPWGLVRKTRHFNLQIFSVDDAWHSDITPIIIWKYSFGFWLLSSVSSVHIWRINPLRVHAVQILYPFHQLPCRAIGYMLHRLLLE